MQALSYILDTDVKIMKISKQLTNISLKILYQMEQLSNILAEGITSSNVSVISARTPNIAVYISRIPHMKDGNSSEASKGSFDFAIHQVGDSIDIKVTFCFSWL